MVIRLISNSKSPLGVDECVKGFLSLQVALRLAGDLFRVYPYSPVSHDPKRDNWLDGFSIS